MTRVKHVFGKDEVFHIFFHRKEGQDWAKDANNRCSWNNNICYSYGTEIGRADFENKVFKFRNGNYSNTTSSHQRNLYDSIPNDWKIISYKWKSYLTDSALLLDEINEFKNEKELLLKSNKCNFDENHNYFLFKLNKINYILKVLGREHLWDVKCNEFYTYKEYFESLKYTEEEINILKVKTWSYRNGVLGSFKDKEKLYNNPEELKEFFAKYVEKKAKSDARKEVNKENLVNKSIEKWYNGEINNINFQDKSRYSWNTSNPVYLRIKDKEVETSKGAKVPLFKAILLYRKLKECIENNKEWKTNGETFTIGQYSVNSIYKDEKDLHWKITVGCHILRDTEIFEFVNRFTNWDEL